MPEETSLSFPTTRWSLIARVANHATATDALGDLLKRYARPMRRYLAARWRASPDVIDDLLQTFVAEKVLEQQILSTADAGRGHFRAFLVAVLNHFASNYFRDQRRLKRGAGEVRS